MLCDFYFLDFYWQNVGCLQTNSYRAPEVINWNTYIMERDKARERGMRKKGEKVDRPTYSADIYSVGCVFKKLSENVSTILYATVNFISHK